MRLLFVAALVGMSSFVASQKIDIAFVKTARPGPPTARVIPDRSMQEVEFDPTKAIAEVVARIRENPLVDSEKGNLQALGRVQKREIVQLAESELACQSVNGTLYGDLQEDLGEIRVQKFLSNLNLQDLALNAPTPANYTLTFQNLANSSQAYGYLGYSVLSSYNVSDCAAKCSNTTGCQAFNVYFERDPSQVPGPACPNPPALINPKCVLWGGPVSADNALNAGQYREQFHVVMTASNGYVLTSTLGPFSAFAINAPLDCNGNGSYMGFRLMPEGAPFSERLCAEVCKETSNYNIGHPSVDPSKPVQLCNFYNTYILSENFLPVGQVCAMYSQSWDPAVYAKNDGQYDLEGNHFTISSSIFSGNDTVPICPADITDLWDKPGAGAFCTSYISYTPPATITQTVISGTTTVESCATTTAGVVVRKRDRNTVQVGNAVVAVFPSKVSNPSITGDAPALATIEAEHRSSPEAYAFATSEALDRLSARLRGLDVAPIVSSTFITVTSSTVTSTIRRALSQSTPDKRAEPVPNLFIGRDHREVSSACSRIVTTGTPTAIVTVPSATETSYSNFPQCPRTCAPRQLIAGDFTSAVNNLDDTFYIAELPFQVCIYGTCSYSVQPTINGIITLDDLATTDYNNEARGELPINFLTINAILYAFYDDLYIYSGQPQFMAVDLCGGTDGRNVTFIWNVGHFPDSAGADFGKGFFDFSVTFFEAQPNRIVLKYNNITDSGLYATVGIQGLDPADPPGDVQFYQHSYLQEKVPSGLELVFDTNRTYFGPALVAN